MKEGFGQTPEQMDWLSNMNPNAFNMSVELRSESAHIVVAAKFIDERNIRRTLDSLDGFISKLKESLILPPDQRWTTLFAADQTFQSAFCSEPTTGSPTSTEEDTPTGAKSEE